jgi:hypothetical protein
MVVPHVREESMFNGGLNSLGRRFDKYILNFIT